MTCRLGILSLGLAIMAAAIVGCAAPYTYYCDDSAGPHSMSGRYGDVGLGGGAACAEEAVALHDGGPGECVSCAGGVARPFGGHTLTNKLRNMVTCNAGCGRVYWGEWSYDPPDDCDPCNNHGDWTGSECCPPHGLGKFWRGLHGARGCSDSGMTDCSTPCGDCGAGPGDVMLDGPMMETTDSIMQPTELDMDPEPVTAIAPLPRSAWRPISGRNPNSRLIRPTMR